MNDALRLSRAPEIFNTDQGSQFTSVDFTAVLRGAGVKIGMDGKGRRMDNVFVERLWRSLKYAEVYLKAYDCAAQTREGSETGTRITIREGDTRRWGAKSRKK